MDTRVTKKSGICCANLLVERGIVSPFSKTIALGYYDGPTWGITQCSTCAAAYIYNMVGWDERQDVRVYVLTPVSEQTFVDLVNILSELESPKWPVWVPRWEFDSGEKEALINSRIDGFISSVGKGGYLLSTEDISRAILAIKPLRDSDANAVQFRTDLPEPGSSSYWISYLEA